MDLSDFHAPAAAPLAQPLLPKGHPPLPKPPPLATYTLDSLMKTAPDEGTGGGGDGVRRVQRLVAVKGGVFDVTGDVRFQPGGRWCAGVARDMTRTLAFAPLTAKQTSQTSAPAATGADTPGAAIAAAASSSSSSSSFTACPPSSVLHLSASHQGSGALRGLDFDQLRTLETWSQFFEHQYDLVGRLLTDHEIEATPEATAGVAAAAAAKLTRPGEADLEPMPSDVYGSFLPLVEAPQPGGAEKKSSLHALMDADDEEACCAFVAAQEAKSASLELPCSRSGMLPIHRAVENGWSRLLRALLDKSVALDAPCALYDDETPLQLAKRFRFEDAVQLLTLTEGSNQTLQTSAEA